MQTHPVPCAPHRTPVLHFRLSPASNPFHTPCAFADSRIASRSSCHKPPRNAEMQFRLFPSQRAHATSTPRHPQSPFLLLRTQSPSPPSPLHPCQSRRVGSPSSP